MSFKSDFEEQHAKAEAFFDKTSVKVIGTIITVVLIRIYFPEYFVNDLAFAGFSAAVLFSVLRSSKKTKK